MAYLNHIETIVPDGSFSQQAFLQLQKSLVTNERMQRYVDGIYQDSGIERRYSVVVDDGTGLSSSFFMKNGTYRQPSTQERNDVFAVACSELAIRAAKEAINGAEMNVSEVTHLITVSCTGFYNPGPDLAIINQLKLSPSTQRYHLGFMGCYASIPALRMAKQFCQAQSDAVVLVVSVELCTLHFHFDDDLDTILANSLFADGAAAAIVSNKPTNPQHNQYRIRSFASSVIPEGVSDMAWTIGNRGFNIVLSRYVPRIIGSNIGELVKQTLSDFHLDFSDVTTWAVHPGGKSIIDKVENSLGLKPSQIRPSRDVLMRYGNMSSATILFVLKRILEQGSTQKKENVFAVAFGPGLVVESALLTVE